LRLEHGASRRYSGQIHARDAAGLAARARALAERRGVGYVAPGVAHGWLADKSRTTYFLDVRTDEEVGANGCRASGARRAASSSRRRINGWSERRPPCAGRRGAGAGAGPSPAGCASSGTKHTCWREASRPPGLIRGAGAGRQVFSRQVSTRCGRSRPPSWRRRSKSETVQVIDLRASMAFRKRP